MEPIHPIGKDISITLNGMTTCYDDFGTGEIPIIFIHGFPFDKSMWDVQMEQLKKTNRVIAYDIRGYGKSSAGEDEQSIRLFADDLLNFMDALFIEKAIVCGFSMGGYTLLSATSRYAKRFEALILCDTQCIADSTELKEKRNEVISQVKSGKINEFTETFLGSVFCPESIQLKPEIVEKARAIILNTSPFTIAGGLAAISQRWETFTTLCEINVPTLILSGRNDAITPVEQAEFMHKNIENAKLYIIENAGHMSNLEQPEQFNKYLDHFIKSLVKEEMLVV
ncbi:MAG: alpha/beta fold hydrolase [Bacteroidetes bacterium]|nr:alpha/beta fold hydrolase [Bacteroidota bacterium]